MPINIELHENFDGSLDGRYKQGDKPNAASGGTPALAWSAPQGLNEGTTLTITTDGTYSFGSRVNAAPLWYQRGNVAYNRAGLATILESGLSDGVTLSEGVNADAFSTCSGLTARTSLGVRSKFGYESNHTDNRLGLFADLGVNQPAGSRIAKWGFNARYSYDLRDIRTASYSSSSGIFDDGDNTQFVLGETFTGTKGTSGQFTGKIIKFDTANSLITFTVNEAYNSSDNNGASITGDSSGATATFDGVAYVGGRAMKLTRSSSDPSITPTNPEVALGYTVVSSSQNIVDIRRSDFGSDDERPNGLAIPDEAWHDYGFYVDYSGSTFDVSQHVDGSLFSYSHTNPNAASMAQVPYRFEHSLFGCDWAGGDNDYGHLYAQIKDPYADDELAGIYIGNAATLAGCTSLVFCRNTAWGNASASAVISFGEIPSSSEAYIYVMDNTGSFISTTGLSIGAIS